MIYKCGLMSMFQEYKFFEAKLILTINVLGVEPEHVPIFAKIAVIVYKLVVFC